MGVGNTGKYLKDWEEGDTYVSDDAGLTWKKALDEPHLYEFGDQGAIIVAIEDTVTDKIKYSITYMSHIEETATYNIHDRIRTPKTLKR